MSDADKTEIFDGILLGLAEKHTGGVPDVSFAVFQLLIRKYVMIYS